MAVRPVDAEKYMELLKEQYLHHEAMGNKQVEKAWQGAMQLLYDMPTLTPPNEWVSVEERLPEVNKPVLVYCDGGFAVSYIFDTDMLTGNPVWNYTGLGGDPWYWTTIPTPPDRRPPEGEV